MRFASFNGRGCAKRGCVTVSYALLASAALAACLPSSASAQTSGETDTSAQASAAQPQAKPEAEGVDDIVVTAYKRDELLSNVGGGISVVTSRQLNERGATSLSDYLALTPGVNLQSIGATGWGWLEIRGIAPQSVGATVSTYVDEIPVGASSALSRSGEYTPDLDPSDLAHVEVLKGPQGTLYGSSSLGGVIKYVTKGPNLNATEINTSQDLNILDNGQLGGSVRASLSTPLVNDVLGIRVSGFYRHDAGYITQLGIARDNANYADSWGFRGALRWRPTANFTIDLAASVENSEGHGYAAIDLDPLTFQPLFGVKDSTYRALDEGFRVRTELFSATVKWDTNLGTLTSATSHSFQAPGETGDITLFFSPTLPGQPQDPTAPISYLHPAGEVGVHSVNKTTEELRFNSKRLGPVEFIVGGFYQHEKLKDGADYYNYLPVPSGQIDTSRPPVGTAWRRGTLDEYAGFANATVYLTDRFDVTGGYRYSHIDQTRNLYRSGVIFGETQATNLTFAEDSSTFLGGIRWRPTDSIMLYGRAASGYRPGGGRSIPPGAPADFGLTYKSDSIWSYEAGVKMRALGGKLVIDADAFLIDWSDIQTLVAVGRYTTDGNGGNARSQGVEIQGTLVPVKGLTLSGNAAYTDAHFTDDAPAIGVSAGDAIYYVPKWTATFAAQYRWAVNDRWNAFVGGDYVYKSSQLDITRFTLPSSGFLNFQAGVDTKHFSLNLYVKNATNKRIWVGDSSGYYPDFPPFEPVINAPRQIGVTFNQKF